MARAEVSLGDSETLKVIRGLTRRDSVIPTGKVYQILRIMLIWTK